MRPERRPSGPEWRGGASRPKENSHSGGNALNPRGLGTESPQLRLRRPPSDWVGRTVAYSLSGSGGNGRIFGTPTAWAALKHMPMMQDAVEHGGDCGYIAE